MLRLNVDKGTISGVRFYLVDWHLAPPKEDIAKTPSRIMSLFPGHRHRSNFLFIKASTFFLRNTAMSENSLYLFPLELNSSSLG